MIQNLRSSLFKSYCMGIGTSRKTQLKNDKLCNQKQVYKNDYMAWGEKHEVNGIAKWVSIFKKIPKNILEEQQCIKIEDWYRGFSLSTTPDGITRTWRKNILMGRLIEVKCSAMGKKTYPEFPEEHMWQIYGQQMIMQQSYDIFIDHTDLVNWTPKHTKIWRIWRNVDFEDYMSNLLREYIDGLLDDKELTAKPKKFAGKHKIELIYNNKGETHGFKS